MRGALRLTSHAGLPRVEHGGAQQRDGGPAGEPAVLREKLQRFFDYCDDRVDQAQHTGRKGWLAAFRDATVFKTIYAWGLRRREAAMLDVVDWSANARAPEFGRFGALSVRYGKATRGEPAPAAQRADDHAVGGGGRGGVGR